MITKGADSINHEPIKRRAKIEEEEHCYYSIDARLFSSQKRNLNDVMTHCYLLYGESPINSPSLKRVRTRFVASLLTSIKVRSIGDENRKRGFVVIKKVIFRDHYHN